MAWFGLVGWLDYVIVYGLIGVMIVLGFIIGAIAFGRKE